MSSYRKDYDEEKYRNKARDEEKRAREFAKENEERISKGLKPLSRAAYESKKGPKPTEKLQQREGPLELDKNVNRTVVVGQGTKQSQPGFYCEVCHRTFKDSASYLDHINSRAHLRKIGQTVETDRSTVQQVRARIAYLKEQTKHKSMSKEYDFRKRIDEIRKSEIEKKLMRKKSKKANVNTNDNNNEQDDETNEMAKVMGFSGFGK